ncbi:MAG: RNA polymerase-associated protein RapA [Verrucomicrobia bacterium ADurb.Bin122]|jgi:superfamily II DNA or RNA helicase|nr:MAG: RNA polymerase-associated protein RapA [Verrucomicrobia bacterium ADurb.Bin122]
MKLVTHDGAPHVILREREDWGVKVYDLAPLPRRLWADQATVASALRTEVDPYQTTPLKTPAELMVELPAGANWQNMSRRSLARLEALALLAEDPQRRLEVREVVTLAHQVSLVRHILDNAKLRRVLIADEVGLGKTVEVALIIKELLAANAGLRVLYLAPARLVSNVGREFRRMGLPFREWKALDSDANLATDDRIIASIHRAVHPAHVEKFKTGRPWDVIVVDECHHLSDWAPGGGDPVQKFRLARDILARQPADGYLFLLSGTPHQANQARFENLLGLLHTPQEPDSSVAGRVIFRTKEDVRDWDEQPLFPRRQVNPPVVCDVSEEHRDWLKRIQHFFSPPPDEMSEIRRRAVGWRCAQALQWAASSPHAGLGYLVRQGIRDGWTLETPGFREALAAMRPYRRGRPDEPVTDLFARMCKEVQRQTDVGDLEDIEDEEATGFSAYEREILRSLLATGINLVLSPLQPKWEALWEQVIGPAGTDKIVLFAQPIETVLGLAGWLQRKTGKMPAIIIGGQSDAERDREVAQFRSADGPQFLISSRAGGEGINLQFAHRLVHLDVPWNPMDMEQRVGRVHRFGSRKTIVVDTLVLKDSREERMWSVARERLLMVSRAMVAPERFEALFSRVMCLVAPESLQEIMLASTAPEIGPQEEGRLSDLVESGFRNWQGFHDRFAANQRTIRKMPAGLARWEDLESFLVRYGGAQAAEGVNVTRFRFQGDAVVALDEAARVIRMKSGLLGLIGDYEGNPVSGETAGQVRPLGSNVTPVLDVLREHAVTTDPVGAALLRWGETSGTLRESLGRNAVVYGYLRQKLQLDSVGGAKEVALELRFFVASQELDSSRELSEEEKASLVRGLQSFSARAKPSLTTVADRWLTLERQLAEQLARPSQQELQDRVRYAVWPLFAAHIEP